MNRTLLIALFLLCHTAGQAQLSTRPIGFYYATYDGSTWNYVDSATFRYAGGNPGYNKPDVGLYNRKAQCDTIYRYKKTGPVWYLDKQQLYKHNTARLPVEITESQMTANSTWQFVNKMLFTYNSNNSVAEELSMVYDQTGSTWRNSKRNIYTYSGSNIIQWDTEKIVNGVWTPDFRYRYAYTGNNMDSLYIYVYDAATSTWTESERNYLTYTTSFGEDSMVSLAYYPHLGTVRNYMKRTKRYDANGNMIQLNYYGWDTSGKWIPNTLSRGTYNLKNQQTADTQSQWNSTLNAFEYKTLYIKQYNTITDRLDTSYALTWDKALSQFVKSSMVKYEFNKDSFQSHIETFGWSASSNLWEPMFLSSITHYYFEAQPLSVAMGKSKDTRLFIYPNPANNVLQVQTGNANAGCVIAIRNAAGMLLEQQELRNNSDTHYIPVSHLAAGNYTITVRNGDEQVSQQFVITR